MSERTRGQSITLNYVLGLGISLLLITGLLISGGEFIQSQQEQAIRTELRVVGQQIAADIGTADRLIQSTDADSTVTLRRSIPETVANSGYTIELVEQREPELLLTTTNPDVEITVRLANQTDVSAATVQGGRIQVNETAGGELTLEYRGDGQ